MVIFKEWKVHSYISKTIPIGSLVSHPTTAAKNKVRICCSTYAAIYFKVKKLIEVIFKVLNLRH